MRSQIVIAALGISISLALIQWLHWRPSAWMTHGGLALLVGFGLNLFVWAASSATGRPQTISVVSSSAVHDVVYFALLPPIIFEAGFSMRKRGFFDSLGPILLYAVAGTLISTFAAGVMLHGLSHMGVIWTELSIGDCMLFAALISPTDPVATLSVLRQVHAPPTLRDCIFGEATLNDALSIVVFQVIRTHFSQLAHDVSGTASTIVVDVLWSMCGSTVVGVGFGLCTSYITRRIYFLHMGLSEAREEVPHLELSLLSTFAFLTFTAAERLGFSGICALFVCGVLCRHYAYHNLSGDAKGAATSLFLTLAALCETALSTLLGVALFDYVVWPDMWDLSLACLTLPVLFVARAFNIFPLSALANWLRRGRKHQQRAITWPMQVVMWFSGMRGALSFALAVTLDDERFPHPVQNKLYHKLVAATLLTIATTTLLMAPATRPLIRAVRLGPPDVSGDATAALLTHAISTTSLARYESSPTPLNVGALLASSSATLLQPAGRRAVDDERFSEPSGGPPSSPIYRLFRKLEASYLKPVVGGRGFH